MKITTRAIPLVLSASSALAAGTLEFSLGSERRSPFTEIVERDVTNTSESALLTNFDGSLGVRYFINLTVGTPPQPQTVFVDTGSSDTLFLDANAPMCAGSAKASCVGGTYNTSDSSTFKMLSPNAITTHYGVNATATSGEGSTEADLVTDVIQVGDIVVGGAHFGVAHQMDGKFLASGDNIGIMGLSYPLKEGIAQGQPKYPTFVESLVGAGAIASRVFSLYLNEVTSYGSILFGGVDTEKYTGNLTTLNLFMSNLGSGGKAVTEFALQLDEVSMKHEDGTQTAVVESSGPQVLVIPDSGTSTWNLPADAYNTVVNMTGVTVSGSSALLPCSQISNTTTFTFTFSGNGKNKAQLQVPLSAFFIPAVKANGKMIKMGGQDACVMMVQPSNPSNGIYLLGDAVLRAGYWVFDMDNGQISIAQARLSSTASNIVAVEAGPHGVMNATHQASSLAANQTDPVTPTATASVSFSLSTAASAVGQTSGPQSTVLTGGAAGSMLDVTAVMSLASALLLSITFGAFLL
ncbi:acid protease [Aureobasidium sp. EXF-10727]|nr:acid protease [Aureobasidium sp. EXF-10727]